MPKKRQGNEVKEHQSIRIEPNVKKKILEKFGKIQNFIDEMIIKENLRPDVVVNPSDKKD